MKHVFIQLLAVLICSVACGQSVVSYSYDNSGNRTSRKTIALKSTSSSEGQSQQDEPFSDQIGKHSIMIYPNPVTSELTVEIQGLDEDADASISLVDQGGHLLLKQDHATGSNLLNLSQCAPGTYILIICVDTGTTRWKIIKQ